MVFTLVYIEKSCKKQLHVAPLANNIFIFLKELRGALESRDPNVKNNKSNAPIHSLVLYKLMGKKKKEERMRYLVTLLTYAKVDVNLMNGDGQTPLHLAVMVGGCSVAII